MAQPLVVGDEEAFVLVRLRRLLYSRGAGHRGVDRQIADIVVVEPEREPLLEWQGVEPARGGKGQLDYILGHAVVHRIEEATFSQAWAI
jgi:hypothetical protein